MALILFLVIPALLVGFVLLGVSVYTRYRNNRLSQYTDEDDSESGGAWKSPTPEVSITTVYYQEAEKEFNRVYNGALARFPKDEKNYYGREMVSRKNDATAWNEAVDHIEGWLQGKRVVHLTGNQNVDFISGHKRRVYVEPVVVPEPVRGSVVEDFMKKHNMNEHALVNMAIAKMEDDRRVKYRPEVSDLIDTVNAERIRETERKSLTTKFIKDLKAIQDKFVVEQEFLKAEIEDRDARLMLMSEKMEGMVEAVIPIVPFMRVADEELPPLEILGDRMSKPSAKRKTAELRRKTSKKKPKRKN